MTTDPNRPSDPTQVPPTSPVSPPQSPAAAADPIDSSPPPVEPPAYAPPADPGYAAPPTPPAGAGFDLARSTTYDRGIAGAAVLFLIALVLPWASVSIDGGDLPGLSANESETGLSSGLLIMAWILLVAAGVLALLPAIGANVNLPFPRPAVILGITGLAALITVIGFFDAVTAPSEIGTLEELGVGVDYSAGIGAYLGLLVAIAAVVLAFLAFRIPRSEAVDA